MSYSNEHYRTPLLSHLEWSVPFRPLRIIKQKHIELRSMLVISYLLWQDNLGYSTDILWKWEFPVWLGQGTMHCWHCFGSTSYYSLQSTWLLPSSLGCDFIGRYSKYKERNLLRSFMFSLSEVIASLVYWPVWVLRHLGLSKLSVLCVTGNWVGWIKVFPLFTLLKTTIDRAHLIWSQFPEMAHSLLSIKILRNMVTFILYIL